ncbi:MAG TPA: sulfatase-like hydrolase/transferase [Gemmataceae bacterium]|nr:sulfatase-like hydrolase/transferase [Gemmataceae bacterium]
MTRRILLTLAGLVAAAGGLVAAEPRKPNVIVILADDMGYADVGVNGCKDIPTPNIDSLAKNGVRCSNGYVSHPYCSPTRAGLLTGRYQQRYGHEFNPGPPTDQTAGVGLPLTETTLADRLKAAGYKTGLVGKWHLGHAEDKFHPLNRGFDEFFGFLGGAHSYVRPGAGPAAIFRSKEPVPEKEYLTDAFAREGVAFIDKHKSEPFFLYWAFNAVHGPMEAAEKYLKRFSDIKDEKRRTYAAMLAALDDAIGRGLAKLREAGIEENTLILFMSDNGGPTAVNASDNRPFNGVKGTTLEGGIHVPFLLQWKGHLPAGKVYDNPVVCLDVLPTALAAAGVEVRSEWQVDGVNLVPYLRGDKAETPHSTLYWRFGGQMAIRMGDWKLVKATVGKGRAGGGGAVSRREKATVEGAQLFNLKDDIGEQTDLAAKLPEKFKELAAAWQKWNADLAVPRWGPPVRKNKD